MYEPPFPHPDEPPIEKHWEILTPPRNEWTIGEIVLMSDPRVWGFTRHPTGLEVFLHEGSTVYGLRRTFLSRPNDRGARTFIGLIVSSTAD